MIGVTVAFHVVAVESLTDLCSWIQEDGDQVTLQFGKRAGAFQKDLSLERTWTLRAARTSVNKLKSELVRLRGKDLVLTRAKVVQQ